MKHTRKILAATVFAGLAVWSGWLLESRSTKETPKPSAAEPGTLNSTEPNPDQNSSTSAPSTLDVKKEVKVETQAVTEEPQARVVQEFQPTRRVFQHPEYGPLVELTYENGVKRYEPTGPGDVDP